MVWVFLKFILINDWVCLTNVSELDWEKNVFRSLKCTSFKKISFKNAGELPGLNAVFNQMRVTETHFCLPSHWFLLVSHGRYPDLELHDI